MKRVHELNFGCFNTRRNLPGDTGRKRGESNFLGAFTRQLLNVQTTPCVFGRNFSMPDCGVADLVLFMCNGTDDSCLAKPDMISIVAYEAKLTNWRRALQQAYRYRYYADQVFVVLPQERHAPALMNRKCFQQFGIGLCAYDASDKSIAVLCNPNFKGALNPKKREKALHRFATRVRNLRETREHFEPFLQRRQMIGV